VKKILFSSIILVLLAGCQSVPVQRTFPEPVKELMESCPELKSTPADTTKLSDVISIVTQNYGQYHQCRAKVQLWIEWYNEQRSIFNQVK
jgi:hypothetical protein